MPWPQATQIIPWPEATKVIPAMRRGGAVSQLLPYESPPPCTSRAEQRAVACRQLVFCSRLSNARFPCCSVSTAGFLGFLRHALHAVACLQLAF